MARSHFSAVLAALLTLFVSGAHYLPGVAPREFEVGEPVELLANKLTSTKTMLPFEYYDLPYCKPEKRVAKSINMGQILMGSNIEASPYKLRMRKDEDCAVLCRRRYDMDSANRFARFIDDRYRVHWVVDNLPVTYATPDAGSGQPVFRRSFPVGFIGKGGKHYLNNHVSITIRYHKPDPEDIGEYKPNIRGADGGVSADSVSGDRIVAFEVVPRSIFHPRQDGPIASDAALKASCAAARATAQVGGDDTQYQNIDIEDETVQIEVIFTYDVTWLESETKWAHRWDVFLAATDDETTQVHWFSLLNSFMIVLFLAGMVAILLTRALNYDIAKYNASALGDEDEDETGWKLLHGDVFRAPAKLPMLLAVSVGIGEHLAATLFGTMGLALLGFLSPANRGGLLTSVLLLFVFCGSFSGYGSARLYKTFGGKAWRHCTVASAALFPGIVFAVFFVLNLCVWSTGSSGAVPFGTLCALVVLWVGVSTPLVFAGSYRGFKATAYEMPVRTNQIARQIPQLPPHMHPVLTTLCAGVMPFAAVAIELSSIMTALWGHEVYYLFGFLCIALVMLLLTCAMVTIILCYFYLCAEDYDWWWRSFAASGSAALYLFGYSIAYFHAALDVTHWVSMALYFGYMGLFCVAFFFLTGSVGFLATFTFLRKIYGAIKVD